MRQIIIASHGSFSKGMMDSITMIIGEFANVQHFSISSSDSQEAIAIRIEDMLRKYGEEDDIIVLTDVLGGSVMNIFIGYMQTHNVHVITGVNLPLALEILDADEETELLAVIHDSIEKGKAGIKYINEILKT
jgi:fructoselysine and glucoselysine-specific PTS system IIA component